MMNLEFTLLYISISNISSKSTKIIYINIIFFCIYIIDLFKYFFIFLNIYIFYTIVEYHTQKNLDYHIQKKYILIKRNAKIKIKKNKNLNISMWIITNSFSSYWMHKHVSFNTFLLVVNQLSNFILTLVNIFT